MDVIYAATIVLGFIVLGELVSTWTRARVPSLLVAMLGVFFAVQLGLVPTTIVQDSLLELLYAVLVLPLLFHMGSLIPLQTMMGQWRSILIALGGMLFAVGLLALIIVPLFSFEHFVAGAGPLAGGIVATSLTTEGLTAAQVSSVIIVLPTMVLMLQSLPSMPLTNFLLRKYAIGLKESGELSKIAALAQEREKAATAKTLVTLPTWMQDNQLVVLFLALLGGTVANLIATPTGIPSSIVALVLGVISTAIGTTPPQILEKSSSFGPAMAGVIAVVMAPLLGASPSDIVSALGPVTVILVIGSIGIMLGGFLVTKLLKIKPTLGMSVALTAMYGFPADYLLTQEVARSVGEDETERKQLLDAMLPAMLVGGFTSVSAGSIVVASVLVSFL